MPATNVDYNKVIKAREEAEEKGKSAAKRAGMSTSFEQQLRDRLKKQRVAEGASKLEEMAGSAWQEYSGTPATVTEMYPNLTPSAYTAGVESRQADVMGDIGQIASMQQTRQQGIQDIIAGIAAGIEAETQRQQELAAQAQQAYQNIFGEYQYGQEQALREQQLALERQKAAQSGAAGGLTPYQMLQALGTVGEARTEQQSVQSEAQMKLNDIDRAIELLRSGKVRTGPVSGRALEFGAKSPWFGSPEQEEFYNIAGRIAAEEMFKLGGKVLPAQEIERLTPFIPADLTQSSSKILTDLEKMRERLEPLYEQSLTRPTQLMEEFLGLGGEPAPSFIED